MAAAIPPSPYPVHPGGNKPAREIWGPYIASKPAYQIFADMAQKGMSISDFIAQDQQAQAKAEGRPDPVKELPENRKYWFHDGEMEILPHWPNPNDPKPAAEAGPAIPGKTTAPADDTPTADPAKTTAPVNAPASAPTSAGSPAPSPLPAPAPMPVGSAAPSQAAPAPASMVAPAPTSAPAEPVAPSAEQAAPPQAARVASVSRSRMPPRQVSHVQRALANASYAAPTTQQSARTTRAAATRPTTRTV